VQYRPSGSWKLTSASLTWLAIAAGGEQDQAVLAIRSAEATSGNDAAGTGSGAGWFIRRKARKLTTAPAATRATVTSRPDW
jgi:hypothetical protein